MASQSLSPPTLDLSIDRISSLPAELLIIICSHLANRDIKSLRLTCKFLAQTARLRLNRAFLSANPRNIKIFRAIADHGAFRYDVTEIIWDDARFIEGPKPHSHLAWEIDEADTGPDEGCPNKFVAACKENIESITARKRYDIDELGHIAKAH